MMRGLLSHPSARFGLAVLLLLALATGAASWIERELGVDAQSIDILAQLAPPSWSHPLGTDDVGRDLLVRLLRGGQISLVVGLATALVAALLGTLIGLTAGYLGGPADALLMRLTDGVIALPLLPVLIVLGAVDPTKLGLPADAFRSEWAGLGRIVVIIGLVGWTTSARLVRAAALSVKVQDFVRAAEALGAGPLHIMARHILPNVVQPMIVATTLSIGNIILLESALSFLGLGVQPPLPSWGNMLSNALDQLYNAPALALWPGASIFLTVLAFNLLGDGLQDTLDPRGGR
ncbi:ABC transporter permease [Telmatospirillum siberiense]|uniref:ABC transporter permease n=1 Tax=Telmatospirillum siberiense TaxID=382514 RepID=A0A2N3PQD6_9PROT|nr:ABC transporter permease [Telmatospirillum siberiense]PKU22610.1 ABC transporter permease [Telmatospirillum siberiense]